VYSAINITNPFVIDAIREFENNLSPKPIIAKTSATMNTLVNRKSLQQYIDTETNTRQKYQAKKILVSLVNDYLIQDIRQPVINRIYLQGVSLQQVKKVIRNAALKDQFQYDMNCAVFALFASVAQELTGNQYSEILNYINNRKQIREQIANETGLSIDEIKSAFTSVGFGKRAKGINNLRIILFGSKIAENIVKEFRLVSNIIYKNFKNGTEKRGTQLSNLFFTWEAESMREFIFQSGQQENLIIHDAVVFLKPVNIKHILSKMKVSFTTHMDYFNFEETEL